tara:strand:+ start:468 stop:1547 length:1080 start_codon:yes stop_codon:yes gene_type:complete
MPSSTAPKNIKSKRNSGPSIREIAAKLELSKSTVSLALGSTEEDCPLAAKTRKKIIEAAEEMGYRANSIARTMRTGLFHSVSLILGRVHPRYLPSELLFGIEEEMVKNDYRLNLTWLDEQKLTSPNYVPKVLEEWSSDGIIIHYPGTLPPKIVNMLERHNIPCIWANSKLKNDCVHPDDFRAGYESAKQLIELGHRSIAYVSFFDFGHYSEVDRYEGYKQAMLDANLEPQRIQKSTGVPLNKLKHDVRFELATEIIKQKKLPTAMICYEIMIAAPILVAAIHAGLKVPEDLSIISFGRFNRNDTGLSISTLQLNFDEVGKEAADMVLQKIKNPKKPLKPRLVTPRLDNMDTIAPPRKKR